MIQSETMDLHFGKLKIWVDSGGYDTEILGLYRTRRSGGKSLDRVDIWVRCKTGVVAAVSALCADYFVALGFKNRSPVSHFRQNGFMTGSSKCGQRKQA